MKTNLLSIPVSNYVIIVLISLATAFSACSSGERGSATDSKNGNRNNHAFANAIEQAHNISAWKEKGAMKATIELNLGGNTLNADLFVETGGPGILLKLSEDTVAIFDGQEMYAMPSDTAVSPFTLKTWAYFLEAPYKLNDPGTVMESQPAGQMHGQSFDRAKLTFEPGTGDTPDDWYILYRSQGNNRLRAMAYIVTAGKSVEEANQNPHAISYENFQTIEGVPVATEWKFWGWSDENGFSDEPIGNATLSDIEFLQDETLFEAPQGATPMKQ